MERWLPPPAEGAFERFLTAAIATIITIMFSWRLLDKINEENSEDEEETRRTGVAYSSPSSRLSPLTSLSTATRGTADAGALSFSQTSWIRTNSREQGRFLPQRVSSCSKSSVEEVPTTGISSEISGQIHRVPVDFPLCGDDQDDVKCAQNSINRTFGEAWGIPFSSCEELGPIFSRGDINTSKPLSDCSIDRRTPGAESQQHAGAVEYRPDSPSQTSGRFETQHSDRPGGCHIHQDVAFSCPALNQNRRDDNSLDCTNYDVASITDSSLEENDDLFIDVSVDNSYRPEHIFVDSRERRLLFDQDNTTDDANDDKDDDFNVSSEDDHYQHNDSDDFAGYDYDDADNDDIQPRELDSDEELFCCSILEPIIEEDSDDITTSSEGDSRSERGLHSHKNKVTDYHLQHDGRKTPVGTPNDTVEDSTDWPETDFEVPSESLVSASTLNVGQRSAFEIKNGIPDLDYRGSRLNDTNTPPAADTDYKASSGGERNSHPFGWGTHTDNERAQFLVLDDCLTGVGEAVFPRDEYSEYVRCYGSSVDRVSRNAVNVRTSKHGDDSVEDGQGENVVSFNDEAIASSDEADPEHFVVHRFAHTFSTRVEVEDSNSDSDESVQTVISRQASREFDFGHGQGVTSRPVLASFKRSLEDLYGKSARKWKTEPTLETSLGDKTLHEGLSAPFQEEVSEQDQGQKLSSIKGTCKSSYDVTRFSDLSKDSKPGVKYSNREIPATKFSGNLEGVTDFSRDSNEPGHTNDESDIVKGTYLYDEKQQAQERDDKDYADYHLGSSTKFVTSCSEKPFGNFDSPLDDNSGLLEYPFVDSHTSTERSRELDKADEMDRNMYYSSEELDGFREGSRRTDTGEGGAVELEDEVVETYVLPMSPGVTALRTMRHLKDFIDQRNLGRGSGVVAQDGSDEAWQSTCTATMIEVEGYGALGFVGDQDVSSGYRDQCHALNSTDRYLKDRLGFELSLDEFKAGDYSTASHMPVVKYIEKERVYVEEHGLDRSSLPDDTDSGSDERKMYGSSDLDEELQRDSENEYEHEEGIEQERMREEQQETEKQGLAKSYVRDQKEDILSQPHRYTATAGQFGPDDTEYINMHRQNALFPRATAQQTPSWPASNQISPMLSDETVSQSPTTWTESVTRRSAVQRPTKIQMEKANTPGTETPNPRSRSEVGISTNTFSSFDLQEKRYDAFSMLTSDVPSRNESVKNYDEFVLHMSGKGNRPVLGIDIEDLPLTSSSAILSGNVSSPRSKRNMLEFENDKQNSLKRSNSASMQEDNEGGEYEEGATRELGKEDDDEHVDNVMKARLVRTSTRQDDEEMVRRTHPFRRASIGSMSDETTSFLNRSFEEPSSGKLTLERSNSEHGEYEDFDRSRVKEGLARMKSRGSLILDSPTDEFAGFPEPARQFRLLMSPGQSLRDVVLESSPNRDKPPRETTRSAASSSTAASSAPSPQVSALPAVWTRVIPGSNFIEEKVSSLEETGASDSSRDTLGEGQEIKPMSLESSPSLQPLQVRPQGSIVAKTSAASAEFSPHNSTLISTCPQKSPDSSSPAFISMPALDISKSNISLEDNTSPTSNADRNGIKFDQDRLVCENSGVVNGLHQESNKLEQENSDESEEEEVYSSEESNLTDENHDEEEEEEEEEDEEEEEGTSSSEEMNNKTNPSKIHHSVEGVRESFQQDTSSTSFASPAKSTTASSSFLESSSTALSSVKKTSAAPSSSPFQGTIWSHGPFTAGPPKKPKSMKEIKKRQKQSYKSILMQDPSALSTPQAAPFVLPDHMMTPSRLKIVQSRNRFLSEENLISDSFSDEFATHKENLMQPTAAPVKDRKYIPKMSRHSKYRSQEQLEKIMHMISLKPGRSEGSLQHSDCLHDDCILSEKGRREILDKTLSIDNLHTDLNKYLQKLGSGSDSRQVGDAFFPETNNDLFDLTFPFEEELNRLLNRPVSMGELRQASDYTTISGSGPGLYSTQGYKVNGGSAQRHKMSKSLCELDTNTDDVTFMSSSMNDSLQRPPSVHDLRINKSLQKLNLPDWYRRSSRSKSTGSLLQYDSSSSMTSWALSPSALSSPRTTPSNTSNVVIRSRVQFPTSARNLRSPRFSSKSAPATPSFMTDEFSLTPSAPAKLPSEKMRAADRPKALMPIPIVPFDKIRAMLEKKKQPANTEKLQSLTSLPSLPHSTATERTQASVPAKTSPLESLAINSKEGTHNLEENKWKVITSTSDPTVKSITSPGDPTVKSILKRANQEKRCTENEEFLNKDKEEVIRPVQTSPSAFVPAVTLIQAPTAIRPPELSSQQEAGFRYGPKEGPVPAERPTSNDFGQRRRTEEQRPFQVTRKDKFQNQQSEEEFQVPSTAKSRSLPKSLRSSSLSSPDEDVNKEHKSPIWKREESPISHSVNGDSSLDSSETCSALPVGKGSQEVRKSPVVTSALETFKQTERAVPDYTKDEQEEPEEMVTVFEGSPVMDTPVRRPSIAPVMSDLSIEDNSQADLYYRQPLEQYMSWDTQSQESVLEKEQSDTSRDHDTPSRLEAAEAEAQPQKTRTWVPKPTKSRSSRLVKSPGILDMSKLDSKHVTVSEIQMLPAVQRSSHEIRDLHYPEESTLEKRNFVEDLSQSNDYPYSRNITQERDQTRSYSASSADKSRQDSEDYSQKSPLERKATAVLDKNFTQNFFRGFDNDLPGDIYQGHVLKRKTSESDSSFREPGPDSGRIKDIKPDFDDNERNRDIDPDFESYENQDYDRRENNYDIKNKDYGRIEVYEVQQRDHNSNRDYESIIYYDRRANSDRNLDHAGSEFDRRNSMDNRPDTGLQHDRSRNPVKDPQFSSRSGPNADPDWGSASGSRISNPDLSRQPGLQSPSSENVEDKTSSRTSLSSGRTWQPKPRRSRRSSSSPSPRRQSTPERDERRSTYKPSQDSNGIPTSVSPYKYKVEGSAFSSSKPDRIAGINTPPADKHETAAASSSAASTEDPSMSKETAV